MAEEVKKFKLFDPFEYERGRIKEILVRRLCVDVGYYRKAAEHIIEHTNNLFGGVFKRTAQVEMVSSAILLSYNIYISPTSIYFVKTLNDLVLLLRKEAEKQSKGMEFNEHAYEISINIGSTPRAKNYSRRELAYRN